MTVIPLVISFDISPHVVRVFWKEVGRKVTIKGQLGLGIAEGGEFGAEIVSFCLVPIFYSGNGATWPEDTTSLHFCVRLHQSSPGDETYVFIF